jgi:hypothetical protein
LLFPSSLHLGDNRQHVVQTLVIDDFRQIALPDQIQHRIAKRLAMTTVARLRSLLGNKPGRTIPVIGLQQPMDLTSTEVEPFGGLDNAQAFVTDLLDEFEAIQFFLRHSDQTGHDVSNRSWSRPG